MNQDWPFDDPPNRRCYTTVNVLENDDPILLEINPSGGVRPEFVDILVGQASQGLEMKALNKCQRTRA
jgi:hypothetical protein